MKKLLRENWEFVKVPFAAGDVVPDTPPSSGMTAVTVPHDWLIWNTKALYEDSLGWYRTAFEVSPEDPVTYLYFEGVYMDVTVWVNGKTAGEWKYGYQSFYFDVTELVKPGMNELTVRVLHLAPNSRWYSGAGIYRPVWQITKPWAHFRPHGLAAESREADGGFWLSIRAEVSEPGLLRCFVEDKAGRTAAEGEGESGGPVRMFVPEPERWSPESPDLYVVRAELWQNGQKADEEVFRYGFRTWRFDADEGFFLNGEHMKLKGVCLHHDLGLLGSAFYPDAAKRQLLRMKEMGVNAIRTSHNMPAPAFLDLCDELGFVVMDEFIDMWRRPKTTYDYARFFAEWAERDVRNWISRDRLHPCVIMWSIGNEIYDTHEGPEGMETMKFLMEQVRLHDPGEHAAVTLGSNYMAWENTQRCADVIKLIGYNYAEKLYEPHHLAHPDWLIYGSETCSTVQSRGIYHFPFETSVLADDDLQCSSLGNSTTSWGAKSIPYILDFEARTKFSAGQFIWTGIDYIGEPTPYHTKNSYFGMTDTALFPKDTFYLFQAGWVSPDQRTVLHLYPYWDWNPGQTIDVMAASNAASVEFFLNGVSLGRLFTDPARGQILVSRKVKYVPGTLEAVAYDEAGRELARKVRHSFGDAARLTLEAEILPERGARSLSESTPAEGGGVLRPGKLCYLTIAAEDLAGRPVENANNEVLVEVSGAGRLLGLDNGDSTDDEPYKTDRRRLFSGKLLAMLEPCGAGPIRVTVHSPGLESASLELEAAEGTYSPSLPAVPLTAALPARIPIRKLELSADAAEIVTPERGTFTVTAKRLPADASYGDITWRVTDRLGVDSLIAKGEPLPGEPLQCKVTVSGDGEFTVRCLPKNGRLAFGFISTLTFTAEGFGQTRPDPYTFITASLYTSKEGEIGNGNERGISTPPDGRSWVAFEGLNFGDFGTDRVTLPIFSLTDETRYRLWKGIPGEPGSVLLCDETRRIKSIWNTYQDMTFALSERLRGIQTFAIEMEAKVHFKGFIFERQEKDFALLRAAEADAVYGDAFTKAEGRVTGIGNNVSLVFEGMDFGEKGTASIRVRGGSPLPLNSIHLLFEPAGGGERSRELLEFRGPAEDAERRFTFAPRRGAYRVTLIFLPGSHFDLASLRFEPAEEAGDTPAAEV